jgi:hypothetical protein
VFLTTEGDSAAVRRSVSIAATLVLGLLATGGSAASPAPLTTVRLDQHGTYIAPAIDGHLVLGASVASVTRSLGPPALRRWTRAATTLFYGPLGSDRYTWEITFRAMSACRGGARRAWSMRSKSPRLDLDSGHPVLRPKFGQQVIFEAIRSDLDRYDPVGWYFVGFNRAGTVGTFGASDAKQAQEIKFGLDGKRRHFLEIRLVPPGATNFPPELRCAR